MNVERLYPLFGGGGPSPRVVGESYHTATLARLFPRRQLGWQSAHLEFELIPEPDNPYDPMAVSVRVAGSVVGYLSRDDAPSWAGIVRRVVASGLVPTAAGSVDGGWSQEWDGSDGSTKQFRASVRLSVGPPAAQLPINGAPAVQHTLLPRGGSLQVQGLEGALGAVRDLAGRSGPFCALVELRRISTATPRGRDHVGIFINGNQIGRITGSSQSRV